MPLPTVVSDSNLEQIGAPRRQHSRRASLDTGATLQWAPQHDADALESPTSSSILSGISSEIERTVREDWSSMVRPPPLSARGGTWSHPRDAAGAGHYHDQQYSPTPSMPKRLQTVKDQQRRLQLQRQASRIFDDPVVTNGYSSVPILEQDDLPRGGVSIDTTAVGRIQLGIPPETIKDSMILGMEVPRVYIVPTERFCSDWGPALGINLAEFEFPAYFNWFVRKKKCVLVVDSVEAEKNIRSVFEETLLGPQHFRDPDNPLEHDPEDFDPDFPISARPNFYEEFKYFRVSEKTDKFEELTTGMLLDFHHFEKDRGEDADKDDSETSFLFSSDCDNIGVPPLPTTKEKKKEEIVVLDGIDETISESLHYSMGEINYEETTYAEKALLSPPKRRAALKQSFSSANRRSSLESIGSLFSNNSANTQDTIKSDCRSNQQKWLYSQIQWLGQVVTVWPMNATPEQIEARSVPRVEIFKMPGSGTEYVIHDVDENNIIVGKARLHGAVCVPEKIGVEGFFQNEQQACTDEVEQSGEFSTSSIGMSISEVGGGVNSSLFHPPSFGVTVLGNSHGFDKKGSTSGYVLWINGRGLMIDPPPYSSATLEREGIRPQMIFGVMITHCHADHDAGAFQKVLTGSRLTVITTPTIYTSFIRKYSALSGLSPNLLEQSHRFRRAIIGQPLKFQGATFHFTYTLHTIPCLCFKVEWRDRSMVFTGDHMNIPTLLGELEVRVSGIFDEPSLNANNSVFQGVLSKGRAESLRQMPLQDCDLLLHEAGAPPIHTPLSVLQELPQNVRDRLYIVHTSALPPDCGLRVAPTGTAGTIRLDEKIRDSGILCNSIISLNPWKCKTDSQSRDRCSADKQAIESNCKVPAVMLRPACISDAWFMLNLISNIPFIASLSYINTMEVLEVASIDVISAGEVVIPARKRQDLLCIVWEGTCIERLVDEEDEDYCPPQIWHAGDWAGPVALQPTKNNGCEISVPEDQDRDVIALSSVGAKVITLPMADLEMILLRGSKLYRQYLDGAAIDDRETPQNPRGTHPPGGPVLETLKINSLLGSLHARQVRTLESLAEGPRFFQAGSIMWRAGGPCDDAYLITSGTVSYQPPQGRTRSMSNTRRSHRKSLRRVMETIEGNTVEVFKMIQDLPPESEFAKLELAMALRAERMEADPEFRSSKMSSQSRKSDQKQSDRNVNKLFARLYASRKSITGLVLSRGCFISDTSSLVSGHLVQVTGGSEARHLHATTLVVGPTGCVAWVFPRATLMPFLDNNPGVLLSLLQQEIYC